MATIIQGVKSPHLLCVALCPNLLHRQLRLQISAPPLVLLQLAQQDMAGLARHTYVLDKHVHECKW